jgi:hypothetical protein
MITVTAQAETGHRLKADSVTVNGGAVSVTEYAQGVLETGNIFAFIMPAANVTVSAGFEPIPDGTYTIVANSSMVNGTVSPNRTSAEPGAAIVLHVSPEPGYRLKEHTLTVGGGAIGELNEQLAGQLYTFVMPAANITVSAEFEPIPDGSFAVIVENTLHGKIISTTASAVAGEAVGLVVMPDAGYQLKNGSLKANGGSIHLTAIMIAAYTFFMPPMETHLTAEFEIIPEDVHIINVSDTLQNGFVVTSLLAASENTVVNFYVTPDGGYRLKEGTAQVNGGAVAVAEIPLDMYLPGIAYSFVMPSGDVTMSAEFELLPPPPPPPSPDTYAISIGSTANGGVRAGASGDGAAIVNSVANITVWLVLEPNSGYRLKDGALLVTRTDDSSAVAVYGADLIRTFVMPASAVTVSAEFELIPPPPPPDTYAISISATANGSVRTSASNNGATIADSAANVMVWLVLEPDSGYRLKDGALLVTRTDDSSAVTLYGADLIRTFAMPASAVTVSTEFELIPPPPPAATYAIAIGATANGNVRAGASSDGAAIADSVANVRVYLILEPDSGYRLKDGTLLVTRTDDSSAVNVYNIGLVSAFIMPASAVTVNAEFELIPPPPSPVTYAIATGSTANGSVRAGASSDGAAIADSAANVTVYLILDPDSGYRLKAGSLQVRQSNNTVVSLSGSGPYSFSMPDAAVTVSAEFEEIIPPGSRNITLELTDLGEGAFSQSTFIINKVGSPNPVDQIIGLAGSWDPSPAPLWDIDNGHRVSTGNSLTINANDFNVGDTPLRSWCIKTVFPGRRPWNSRWGIKRVQGAYGGWP